MNRFAPRVFLCVWLAALPVVVAANVDVSLSCPATVSYGTGTTSLVVTARVENNEFEAISLQRYAATVFANGSNTVTGARIYGPLARTRASPLNIAANGVATTNLAAMAVPNVTGKMAFVTIEFLTNTGHTLGGDGCWVAITP